MLIKSPFLLIVSDVLRGIAKIQYIPILLIIRRYMFNPLKMAGDMKGMEKMLKPALEKFMQESGFVKKTELEKLESRVKFLEDELKKQV
jgi:hypothetical protein